MDVNDDTQPGTTDQTTAAGEVSSPPAADIPPWSTYLVFDTETSGLPDFKLPADDPTQPRLASVSFILCDDKFEIVHRADYLVKPDGWGMTPEASAKTGLTDLILMNEGVPVMLPLLFYTACIEAGLVAVAHHAQFDCKTMRGELRRAGMDDLFEKTKNICTMRGMAEQCRMPAKNGRGYKWPKLAEAYHFATKKDLQGAHKSVNDAYACWEIAKFMHSVGALPEAAVHYSKTRNDA